MKPKPERQSPLALPRRVLAYGLAGLVTTILISWVLAAFMAWPQYSFHETDNRSLQTRWTAIDSPVDQVFRHRGIARSAWQIHGPETLEHGWEEWVANVNHLGFPLPALESMALYDGRSKQVITGAFDRGLEIPLEWSSLWMIQGRTYYGNLPLRPVWPGLLINTALWGAVVYALARLYRWRRGVRRAKRGRCRVCAYDLAGLASCPECGVTARIAPAPAS